jgi:sugar lactone lactonase YvrE
MYKFFGSVRAAAFCVLAVTTPLCLAVDTHVWQQNEQAEFERGTAKNISIRSDGRLTLAPAFKELLDAGLPYLWTVTQDSKGTLYCAGGAPTGATTKIFAVTNGKSKTFAELTGLEIHVLAVDSKDRLYAAVLPDAKIFRIDSTGKSELFFDTKQKYVWAMAFDKAGNLFVATGDQGVIYKVTPDGKGTEFFKTEETHARSMIVDRAGNLIVGTEPSGLVLRISPQAASFVLFQTAKKEVTAVEERDGVIYAASVGQKTAGAGPPTPTPAPAPTAPGGTTLRVTAAPSADHGALPVAAPLNLALASNAVSGGSEFYRIEANGFAERLWASGTDVIYAIGFDPAGKPLLGTGNKGVIYRVDSDLISTQLLTAGPTQVTDFATGRDGVVYAVTGNVGKLYSIGPGYEQSGSIESEVMDAGSFTYWGKAHLKDELHGGTVQLDTRSGNLSRPQKNWSDWQKAAVTTNGGQVESPAARFLQYRLTLTRGGQNETPTVTDVEVAYQAKNVAPRVRQIEVDPANYRYTGGLTMLERSTQPSGSPSSLSLPPVGQKRGTTPSTPDLGAGGAGITLQYAKGYITARWSASDENGDPLIYKVEIRGKGEPGWHLLKDKLTEKQLSWDGSSFPDGEYTLRVTASDAPGNTPADALMASLESDPFTIDNTPAEILNGKVTKEGGNSVISFTAKDALSWVDKAEYSVDGADWILLDPVNRVTDSQTLDFKLTLPAGAGAARVVAIRVFDDDDNVVVTRYLVP